MKIIIDISTVLLQELLEFSSEENITSIEETISYLLHSFMAKHREDNNKKVKKEKK